MRPSATKLGQTIAVTGLLATLLIDPAAAQAPQEPSGTGVKQPSNESLIEKSKESSVKADAIWIEITNVGKNASRWVLDLNREGSCYVLRFESGVRSIHGGTGIPKELVKRAFTSLTKRSVIYGSRKRSATQESKRQLVGIGMATWDGSRVYKTQSSPLDSYPDEVQKVITDLQKTAQHLPVSVEAMGSIQSTFLRPGEIRRMLEGGKKVVTVEDPGRNAQELSTLEMAVRLPGRDIVVPSAEDWEALLTYVAASNPGAPDSEEFYVKSSKRTYRVTMDAAEVPNDGLEDGLIPRAKPVQK